MTNILIGSAITVLLAIIGYLISLAKQVHNNRYMIIEERTRSISEDNHHRSELDTIKEDITKILNKLDILTKELLGNGK